VRAVLPIGAKYRTKQKLIGLQSLLTESNGIFETADGKKITSPDYQFWQIPTKIKESAESAGKSPDFLICAFSYDRRRAKFFRSNFKSAASGSPKPDEATLCEAIHASTNAPVNFFVSPAWVAKKPYWDGAIAALNNPTLAAVTEALANGVHARRIQVLSLGTGTVALPSADGENRADYPELLQKMSTPTLFGDVAELSTSILDDPPDTSTYVTHVILSSKRLLSATGAMEGPVVRMTPLIRPSRASPGQNWTLPKGFTKEEFDGLVNLDLDATSPQQIALLTKLGNAWIAGDIANQAIRENSDFEPYIGEGTFAGALQHWRTLMEISSLPLRADA
jgi:hypothetical protein